jgi:hypothetical protein
MRDLALQVRELHHIIVDQADTADAGGGEVEGEWGAETAGADDQDTGVAQPGLAGAAQLGEKNVPGIALDLVLGESQVHGDLHRRSGSRKTAPAPEGRCVTLN